MYENWFLDYASYVILERAVPSLQDGLKPVQRRILHAMKQIDDGRFHKVANIIGYTMQYHPHGDAAIADALVNLGQKELLIETQGNWGDIRTGDSAAAPRYIEARLSQFAREVAFNPDITEWELSYDGRKKEPVALPVKFPLLLAQGIEGIAVGLSTKIMPHNFNELIDASIDVLQGKETRILPDFPTGGLADFNEYNRGQRGGRIRLRCHIEVQDKKTLVIRDVPYGTTTHSLIDSIVKANDKGKIKIKRVIDNTAEHVEILVELAPNTSPDMTIDALYAFTDCEISIAANTCVIVDDKPQFLSVDDVLERSTHNTVELLKRELEIRLHELQEKILFSSLEKIFIEKRIYRKIEECETWESVLETIDKGLEKYKKQFYREITQDDIIRLTEIRIKRISKYDSFKADEQMRKLQEEKEEVEYNLDNLNDYAIRYFRDLKKRFGQNRERQTEIRSFDTIEVSKVAVANQKLFVNWQEGFVGYGLKKTEAEQIGECSDIDDIITFQKNGKYMVHRIAEKTFVGKDLLHAAVWKKNDERTTYNVVYWDPASKRAYAKRFQVPSVTREREYDVTTGAKGAHILYFSANPNGEAEVVNVTLTPGSKAKKKVFELDFANYAIKGRNSKGNIVSRYPVRKVAKKAEGHSTLGGLHIWFDETVGRLNKEERGTYLGEFQGDDRILALYRDGTYVMTTYELTNRYDPDEIVKVEKFDPQTVVSAIYYSPTRKSNFLKRFQIETSSIGQPFKFISDEKGGKLIHVTTAATPYLYFKARTSPKGEKEEVELNLLQQVGIKGWKARGNKFPYFDITHIKEEDLGPTEEAYASEAVGTEAQDGANDQSDGHEHEPSTEEKGGFDRVQPEEESNESVDIGESVEWDVNKNDGDESGDDDGEDDSSDGQTSLF